MCRASSRKRHADLVRAREDAAPIWCGRGTGFRSCCCGTGCSGSRSAWTREHDRWLAQLRFAGPPAVCFDESYGGVREAKARRDRLDSAIAELAAVSPYVEGVGRLCCLRGASTLTAFALTVELGDWSRFDPARLGAFLGLVLSERSSGEQRRQGPITKTGDGHARRLLVEAAWHQRRPIRPSLAPAHRRAGQPATVRAEADAIQPQTAPTLVGSRAARQTPHDRRVAVARELASHCWKLATMA